MKRFLRTSPIVLLFISLSAFATSFTTIILAPNDGVGGNFQFRSAQPGFSAFLAGTVPQSFYPDLLIAPGSTLGGTSKVFVDGGAIKINGVSYDELGLDIGTLFVSTFTFPTNGKNFTIPISASFSVEELIVGYGFVFINGTASGKVTFKFNSNVGLYSPSTIMLTTVPEPATLGLLGIGLTGVLALGRSKLKRIQRTTP